MFRISPLIFANLSRYYDKYDGPWKLNTKPRNKTTVLTSRHDKAIRYHTGIVSWGYELENNPKASCHF